MHWLFFPLETITNTRSWNESGISVAQRYFGAWLLASNDELYGYNWKIGDDRTLGTQFRAHERWLVKIGGYQFLPETHLNDSIGRDLPMSWHRGGQN